MIKQYVVKLPLIYSETVEVNVRCTRDYLVSYLENGYVNVKLNGVVIFSVDAVMFYRNGIKMPLLDSRDEYKCELKALNKVMNFLYNCECSQFVNDNKNNVIVIPHHLNRKGVKPDVL